MNKYTFVCNSNLHHVLPLCNIWSYILSWKYLLPCNILQAIFFKNFSLDFVTQCYVIQLTFSLSSKFLFLKEDVLLIIVFFSFFLLRWNFALITQAEKCNGAILAHFPTSACWVEAILLP